MKSTFTILWIEDRESVIDEQTDAVSDFLSEREYELVMLKDTDGTKFEGYLASQEIDLIIVDDNFTMEMDGGKIIEMVRDRMGILTDILFYSASGLETEKRNETAKWGLVEFHDDKDVEEKIMRLIEKNIKRLENVEYLRGFIIARSIDLELKINVLLATYFRIPGDMEKAFHEYMMENRFGQSAAKVAIVKKIIDDHNLAEKCEGLKGKLDEIYKMRNKVAHSKASDPNTLVSMGEPTSFNRAALHKVLRKMSEASAQIEGMTDDFKKEQTD